jgi:hypothetical protein
VGERRDALRDRLPGLHLVILCEEHMDVLEEADAGSTMHNVVGALLAHGHVSRLHAAVLAVHITLNGNELGPHLGRQLAVGIAQKVKQLLLQKVLQPVIACNTPKTVP